MNIILFFLAQLLAYGVITWIVWLSIAFCGARFLRWVGFFLSPILITALLLFLDLRWIRGAMRAPGWDGSPDMDGIFFFGLLVRIILINGVLLPVSIYGLRLALRARTRNATNVA